MTTKIWIGNFEQQAKVKRFSSRYFCVWSALGDVGGIFEVAKISKKNCLATLEWFLPCFSLDSNFLFLLFEFEFSCGPDGHSRWLFSHLTFATNNCWQRLLRLMFKDFFCYYELLFTNTNYSVNPPGQTEKRVQKVKFLTKTMT